MSAESGSTSGTKAGWRARVTAMLALVVQLVWVHPEWVKRELMLSMEPRLGKMVREPYDSSTVSHREHTDSTLQKQLGVVISGEPDTADIRSEFALAIAGEILDEGDDDVSPLWLLQLSPPLHSFHQQSS